MKIKELLAKFKKKRKLKRKKKKGNKITVSKKDKKV